MPTTPAAVLTHMRAMMLALFALGCSSTVDVPIGYQDREITPTIGIDENVADLALDAVVMWEQATGGTYAPDTHIGCDGSETWCIRVVPGMLEQCRGPDDTGIFNGCCDGTNHEIRLSESMMLDEMISTLAHELGHSLGLDHGAAGLMAPTRDHSERHSPCIDQGTLDAFSTRWHVDPATLGVTCYGDDIRAKMLERLDAIR